MKTSGCSTNKARASPVPSGFYEIVGGICPEPPNSLFFNNEGQDDKEALTLLKLLLLIQ